MSPDRVAPGFPMPANLVAEAWREGRSAWLATLPRTLGALAARWSLTLGPPFQPGGATAWVAPAVTHGGEELVAKVCWAHPEAEQEAEGLWHWDGDGTVRLLDAVPVEDGRALLLERCVPGTPLRSRPEGEQDVVIAGLLRRLWSHPAVSGRFRPLGAMCDQWADEYEAAPEESRAVLDPALQRRGIALLRSLPRTAPQAALLCTDLHAGNVLAARREPWLVIDPKPYVGDPTYDAVQHLLNCENRLHTDPVGLAARMAGLLALDPERLLEWLFARCVQESPTWPSLAAVALQLARR